MYRTHAENPMYKKSLRHFEKWLLEWDPLFTLTARVGEKFMFQKPFIVSTIGKKILGWLKFKKILIPKIPKNP